LIIFILASAMARAASSPGESGRVEFRPEHAFPKVGKYEVLACDFHMHTTYSDGGIRPRERVLEAYRQGYDAIAISDHGRTEAYYDALNLANALGIILIRAFESGMAGQEHFVVLNAPDGYTPVDAHNWAMTKDGPTAFYQDQLETIAKLGGLVIYAHPHVGYREPVLWAVKRGLIQGLEVKNGVVGSGWNTVQSHGSYCYPSAFDFALKNKLAIIANSDSHGPRAAKSEITYVLVRKRSVKGILDAIKAQRTFAYFDGMVWGPGKLLADTFKAGIAITEADSDAKYVRIHNRGPIPLKIRRSEAAVIDIGPYGEAMVPVKDAVSGMSWELENVWIDLKTNLTIPVGASAKFSFVPPRSPFTNAEIAHEIARQLVDLPTVATAATPEQFTTAFDNTLDAQLKQRMSELKTNSALNVDLIRASAGKVALAFRTSAPPVIDGRLDEAVWRSALPRGDFMAYTSGKPVETRTQFAVCYDDTNLYLGVWCDQPPDELAAVAPMQRRDEWDRNSVELFLGREEDSAPAWQIMLSRGGQVWDGCNSSASWNSPGLQSAGNVTADQWTAELAIPWKDLGMDPKHDRVSLLNVARNRCRKLPNGNLTDEISTWFLSINAHINPLNRGYLLLK